MLIVGIYRSVYHEPTVSNQREIIENRCSQTPASSYTSNIKKTMKRNKYILITLTVFLFHSCGLKTAKELGIHFSTEKSKLPATLNWKKIGFAKELINQKEMIIIISGGTNPIPLNKWNEFKPSFPYRKHNLPSHDISSEYICLLTYKNLYFHYLQ